MEQGRFSYSDRGEKVTMELSSSEALVLFELLSRWEQKKAAVPTEDQAEEQALWNFLPVLESTLVEPFMPDYLDRLTRARERLRPEPD
jgi:hypothetical protein